ncbi:MAG: SpoIIIAH-like family protein [Clostridiales bacterium]|nr:SpoIIIAH-like family protein [Clostridiales bacterium]
MIVNMKILKRNQIIISVIALVLITVGYMNFTSNTLNTTETTGMLLDSEQMAGIGDAKLVNSNNVVNNNEEVSSSISDSAPENEVNTQNTTTNVVEDVSAKNYSSEYFVASKLERDKMYSQMLETYQRLLENSTITAEQKAIFTQELTKINNEKTSIMISENLITNMGYENVVIFINDNSVSVIIKAEKLEEADIAKIQNIVCREIGVSTEMVHISLK